MTHPSPSEPVVITGIGLVTALGLDRESTWSAIKAGKCGIDYVRRRWELPEELKIAAEVKLPTDFTQPDRLRPILFSEIAFHESLVDSGIDLESMDPYRIGIGSTAHIGDLRQFQVQYGLQSPDQQFIPWWSQWLPNSCLDHISKQGRFYGPRLCYSTACASSMIALIQSVRAIRRGECDVMIVGGGEGIDSLFATGFHRMRALSTATTPQNACQPFDVNRSGFVMGEGAAYLVVERLSHAQARNATIYAEVLSERMASQAHHITSVEMEDEALNYLIKEVVRSAQIDYADVEYINAHGTGTVQNDSTEISCINSVFGSHADTLHVSSTKSQIGHLVNASGCAEIAITTLGMRDGVSPPTVNLQNPEPICRFDCVAKTAQTRKFKHALKLSMAFGGHLAGVAIRRFDSICNGFAYPDMVPAANHRAA